MKSIEKKAIIRILIITIVNCIIVLSVPLSMNYYGWKGLLLPMTLLTLLALTDNLLRKYFDSPFMK